jgi:tetratricopeptide (TPR) repeat protein
VRRSMREGAEERALHLVAAASRAVRDAGPACGRELAACEDELGYLEAEALRGAGRIDQAVAAYRALNRPGAPPAMRQNALYAAAELERRRGRTRAACADYEGALTAAPRGALREEALVGAMECAEELGDRARAAALGRKYLAEFPDGRAAPDARRSIAGALRP